MLGSALTGPLRWSAVSKVVNIAVASVGGQGGLTLSRILAVAAVLDGHSVRTGETLGMSQRFGSVISYVRIGRKVLSPTFSVGEADFLLGLELVESVRALPLLRSSGIAIVADTLKIPISASLEKRVLRVDELSKELMKVSKTVIVPASKMARDVGNPRAANMVILGVFQGISGLLTETSVRRAISEVVPSKWLETSLRAFSEGLRYSPSGQQ